ncbi:MAG: M14 family metallopeptidase [Casimicrobiaceae bacterium]
MSAAGCFSVSYADARGRFRAAAQAAGAMLDEHVLPGLLGADGEILAIDTARLGDPAAPAMLLISSGTHGVEGFAGSGAQVALLADDELGAVMRSGAVALLMVHALNPFGFSHLRRANEANIDLNRNFCDFTAQLPDNALYAELHPYLLPSSWPPSPDNGAALMAFLARYGIAALQGAISGGQYAFPDGLFYGGRAPSWSRRVVCDLLRAHGGRRMRLGWIDVHSGLGPFGEAERIQTGGDDPASLARARAWWGDGVTTASDGSSRSAATRGELQSIVRDECPAVEHTGIVLEFGTLPLLEVLTALRAEQWSHNHPEAEAAVRRAAKEMLRVAFYPDTDAWRARVVEGTRAATHAALRRLGS